MWEWPMANVIAPQFNTFKAIEMQLVQNENKIRSYGSQISLNEHIDIWYIVSGAAN